MLRWPRSLALRAVSALLAVHVITIALLLGISVSEGRSTPLGGSSLALEFAREELRFERGRWVIPPDGAFQSLAARNSSPWLIARDGDGYVILGDPPAAARRIFGTQPGPSARSTDDFGALLAEAAIERHSLDGRPILLAAGGVDPQSVTSGDILRSFSLAPLAASIAGLGLLGGIALLLAIPLLSRAIRPVVEEAASIRPDDVGRRLDEKRAPPELLPLAQAFNGALERLEVELGRRRRLISNVAHELRTPLAVLLLRVDTVSAHEEEREELRAAVLRVSRLAEQMFDLERLSLSKGGQGPVDLTEVTREVVSTLAPMAMNAGCELTLDAQQVSVVVSGSSDGVARAVTNLIGNAVQHGGRGTITVVLRERQLEVIDEGPGVPTSLQPRLFEAFARGADGAGSGLGLHLTREVMRGMGGDVDWRREGARTIFRLRFKGQDARAR